MLIFIIHMQHKSFNTGPFHVWFMQDQASVSRENINLIRNILDTLLSN